ncbi:hypothetical protein QBC43DRAFT_219113 [Cladorrhinum sp. PSN259]|nr:hypothetical protein QBC43DRAFT_219113 [Cladorrhinum sp. PSN259]
MGIHSLIRKAKQGIADILPVDDDKHFHTHDGHRCHEDKHADYAENRFCSFVAPSQGHAKWYVDGASYFWAVSMAIEEARESIYILDWWLSPELYLRRPPARNENYRLDKLLKAAAERGVKINIIVYKEVEAALTLNSIHTKHALEALHTNIKVFRYPDHHPAKNVVSGLQDLHTSLKNLDLKTFNLAKASSSALESIYGTADDVVLYWAHHEKLCLIDGKVAFMGGLDLCFGRYDTNSHPLSDAHPGDIDGIIFPGQDYNNARIYDFEDVSKWENNKLDRTKSSRMGWSDIALSITGPVLDDLARHFCERWNFIFNRKYTNRDAGKYSLLQAPGGYVPGQRKGHREELYDDIQDKFSKHVPGHIKGYFGHGQDDSSQQPQFEGTQIQLTRSICKWSLGISTEHSIANAYIETIKSAKHYVYIENQFFITACSDKQRPVQNKIGRAIVDRIIRAHQNHDNFQVVILMPAVPAFAGDLKSEGALGTRAIMEFQYDSINRGGNSILETLRNAGVSDPHKYINFYNLRNYDRINVSEIMRNAEKESGVSYEQARLDFEDRFGAYHDVLNPHAGDHNSHYYRYQQAAAHLTDSTWDTVSPCYMNSGLKLSSVPWTGSPEDELNAYVSEQLYIHSKVLIADDKIVICGSANLNDRSQLGNHDSEIAVVIEDASPVNSYMNGKPYVASAFAASLRRQLYRKHLGLLPHQKPDAPDSNWTPASHSLNAYDWDSPADRMVIDPLSPQFLELWRNTAHQNTEIFTKAFHPVPNDKVRTWKDYDEFFSRYFIVPGSKDMVEQYKAGKVDYGHIVKENFPGGVDEVKRWLSGVRGNLVEMPLNFLIDVDDIAKDGLTLNTLTDDLYT